MATTTRVVVDAGDVVGPVRPELFGGFVEHLGRAVYTGLHEPGHPLAGADGMRGDVLDLVRELGVTTVRYPGGNFVSAHRWEDGVGPPAQRPVRLDPAWHSTEPNTVGVDELVAWCRRAGVEPMMAVNLGTRGTQEALDLLEYCNHPGGTALSDRRRANGSPEPHRIRTWCLGNEMDGPWQVGHRSADEYGRLAGRTARAMRMLDPDLVLVACGSSGLEMPTFGAWEREVLRHTADCVDLISAHSYFWLRDGDLASFLASGVELDRFVTDVVAAADEACAAAGVDRRIDVSVDEWNVWDLEAETSRPPTGSDWPVAPRLLEQRYSVADAVVVGSLLMTLLERSDRVAAASLAQLVNVIAPIMTEPGGPAWRQSTFHPFALTARWARGDVVRCRVDGREVATARSGDVPAVAAVATWAGGAGGAGDLTLLLLNRSPDSAAAVEVDLRGLPGLGLREALVLAGPDPTRVPTLEESDGGLLRTLPVADDGARLRTTLPAASWAVVRLAR